MYAQTRVEGIALVLLTMPILQQQPGQAFFIGFTTLRMSEIFLIVNRKYAFDVGLFILENLTVI